YEILLVNDGSDDATRDGLHALAANNIRILNNDRNRGYAHSNNHGALHARGEFLFLLNNDLILQPGWLEPMLAGFKRVKRLGIIGNVQLDALSGAVDHSGVSISAQTEIHHVK